MDKQRIESLIAGIVGAAMMAMLLGPLVKSVDASYIPVPPGTIAYYNSASCPAGWSEFTTARGAYIVGRVAAGTLATLVGSALTNQENRTHTHTATAPATSKAWGRVSDSTFVVRNNGDTAYDIYVNPGGGGGGAPENGGAVTGGSLTSTQSVTIAPYIQLLVCSKS